MSDFPSPHEGIILDACCVINLYASGYMQGILQSVPTQVSVATFICDHETNKIYSGCDIPITSKTELINLHSFIDRGLLQAVSPENEMEENTVINLSAAAAIDSGEAITAALAMHRRWSLATDDKAAIAFFRRNTPQLHIISTLDIVKHWADTTSSPSAIIKNILNNIQNRARYRPHYKHHLYGWWKHHILL